MKIGVAKPAFRDPIHRWSRDDATERARCAEAAIVGHDEQHVRRGLGRDNARRPPWCRFRRFLLDHAAKFWIWRRELFAVNRSGRARRTGRASRLDLCSGGRRDRHDSGNEYRAQEDASVWFHLFASVSRFGLISQILSRMGDAGYGADLLI